jgi:hypothetical protein
MQQQFPIHAVVATGSLAAGGIRGLFGPEQPLCSREGFADIAGRGNPLRFLR